MKYFLIAFLLFIIIIYTIYDRISYLYYDNSNDNKNNNNIITYNTINDNYHNYNKNDDNDKIDVISKYYPIEKIMDNKEKKKEDNDNDNDIFIKYSSIKNKLETDADYSKFYANIDTIRDSMYISIIDNIIYNDTQLIEIIINDIQKTKLKYDFNKLKNIFVIKKKNDKNTKLILFYDGLIINTKKFRFVKNNFMGNTIVYKLDYNNSIINHYLQ
jgi:hypothetical protein